MSWFPVNFSNTFGHWSEAHSEIDRTAEKVDENPRSNRPQDPHILFLKHPPEKSVLRTLDARQAAQIRLLCALHALGVRYEHLVTLRQWLAESFKPATANRYLAVIKGTLREAWRLTPMAFRTASTSRTHASKE